ncbi:hypothetical protein BP6252_05627 [Coleophoma cylindrospora]|uniref:Uncharacterized protein n=1 Tax=Coleophoma cylindrospora TaxID=1849047 RepID=A0A3D8RUP2_9HELO|nr:hypothetical protein BP6252_05627 [Coleophoma cylindrospora]
MRPIKQCESRGPGLWVGGGPGRTPGVSRSPGPAHSSAENLRLRLVGQQRMAEEPLQALDALFPGASSAICPGEAAYRRWTAAEHGHVLGAEMSC